MRGQFPSMVIRTRVFSMLNFPLLLSSIVLLVILSLIADSTACNSDLAHHVAVTPDNDFLCLGLTEGKISLPL